jgi:hypothetical protein
MLEDDEESDPVNFAPDLTSLPQLPDAHNVVGLVNRALRARHAARHPAHRRSGGTDPGPTCELSLTQH